MCDTVDFLYSVLFGLILFVHAICCEYYEIQSNIVIWHVHLTCVLLSLCIHFDVHIQRLGNGVRIYKILFVIIRNTYDERKPLSHTIRYNCQVRSDVFRSQGKIVKCAKKKQSVFLSCVK